MNYKTDFQKTIEDAFLKYGMSVAQERSIPDVRDGLKIGLRQGLYAQYSNGLMNSDKFQKAQKSVAAAMSQSYLHGDISMYDTFIRAAKPWIYRYPLESVQGAYGDPCAPDNHSASRYVEMKASAISDYLLNGINKNAITEWYNNYDDTEKIPNVFPSVGYWNVINGCTGIAVGMVTSVPQFNLTEVNTALIKLIREPNAPFDSIYCAPDFAQGGTIINASDVKNAIQKGTGASIKMRADLTYDASQNVIKATQMPYGIFTNTVIGQLKTLTDKNEDYGIEKVVDHTKKEADIRIYLKKGVNPSQMMAKLYKDTSLESSFQINMLMLDNGRFPRVFGWKDACLAYIAHCRECEKNILTFELDALNRRLNIVNGLITAANNIDDVIAIIKKSENYNDAFERLTKKYKLNDEQVKAILSMRLSALAKTDSVKLVEESRELGNDIALHTHIISTPTELDNEIIKKLQEVIKKFGDGRRTVAIDISKENENDEKEVQEIAKDVIVTVFSNNTITIDEKPKIPKGASIISTHKTTSAEQMIVFTTTGKVYTFNIKELKSGENSVYKFIGSLQSDEQICYITVSNDTNPIIFVTKNGYVKKSEIEEYRIRSKKGSPAIKLDDTDSVINVFQAVDNIFIMTSKYYVCFSESIISCSNRLTKGVIGIKLGDGDFVVAANHVKDTVVVVNGNKQIEIGVKTTSRAIKGHKIDGLSTIYCADPDDKKLKIFS